MGRGSGPCKNVDSIVFVWVIILIAVTVMFVLAGVLNTSGDISESEAKGGPWYMWYIIVMAFVIVFVIIYMISVQYAEGAVVAKYTKTDTAVDLQATRKLTSQRV